MSNGKCRSCKFDMSDDQGIFRTSACPDYLAGKITDGCELYEADDDMALSLKEQEKKQKQEAKEREKYRKKKEKAEKNKRDEERYYYNKRAKARRKRSGTDRRPLQIGFTIILGTAIIFATLYIFEDKETTTPIEPDDGPTTATENITEMIFDLTPSLVLLVFVMVFMLMLLTIVDRVGRW